MRNTYLQAGEVHLTDELERQLLSQAIADQQSIDLMAGLRRVSHSLAHALQRWATSGTSLSSAYWVAHHGKA